MYLYYYYYSEGMSLQLRKEFCHIKKRIFSRAIEVFWLLKRLENRGFEVVQFQVSEGVLPYLKSDSFHGG